MDLASFEVVDQVTVHLHHPRDRSVVFENEDGSPMEIQFYGPGTSEYRRAQFLSKRALMKKMAKLTDEERKELPEDYSFYESERIAAETWAGIISHWNITFGGRVELTTENVVSLFEKHHWIMDQLEEALGEDENFMEKLSESSSDMPNSNSDSPELTKTE